MGFVSKRVDEEGKWLCLNCKQYKDIGQFFMTLRAKNGVSKFCRQCILEKEKRVGKPYLNNRWQKEEKVRRDTVNHFARYFSQNQFLFRETFGKEFSKETAVKEYSLIKDCLIRMEL